MNNIVLVGFMAVGKSTIGKELSDILNKIFIDTDEEVEKIEKNNIYNIFKEKGENYFRNLETKVLQKVKNQNNIVLSTGGGIVGKDENITILKQIGTVIWLCANEETILKNLKKSTTKRPILETENVREKIHDLIQVRFEKYKKASDIIITVDNKTVKEVVSDILFNLNKM
ncbi:shikimate kinase [Alkalithermobacter thermoalcaliphilus JW-YL-7 = DSM 7308]|uniref:Shikimate kinase n=1 Tax=Alkalithermobacter thermoalcaliphilus JW-YL-7 = DSM 7308 TaxID=1121328 RepID=A0A150FSC8_CLOPD|nr:Shikimate kinase [[Clostridium] paradoxum JW-YL-7 = DSM 7308]SHL00678.1 shikimate kinase [[Clostridium] paradoxum JW-YL-7 = DSM 7308]